MTKHEPQPGDLVAKKYRIDRVLGRGGMGVVYAATHEMTGKQVALKWMLPSVAEHAGAVDRFIREARAAGRINSPNVVSIHDVVQQGEAFVLVMELLVGEPLTEVLEAGTASRAQLLAMLLGAMRGVAAAHSQGVIHRDLKPDNVFVQAAQPGIPRISKVLDFGVSKLSAREGETVTRLTQSGTLLGTPYYMSPEQAKGDTEIDRRSDIYAFGVILYEALTGQVPFHAESYGALLLKIMTEMPAPPSSLRPDISPQLDAVVLKAMARAPANRFATMEELIAAIEPYTHEGAAVLRSPPSQTRNSITPLTAEAQAAVFGEKRSSARSWLVATVLLVGAGGGWLAYDNSRSNDAEPPNVVVPTAAAPLPVADPTPAPATQPEPVPAAQAKPDAGTMAQPEASPAAQPMVEKPAPKRVTKKRKRPVRKTPEPAPLAPPRPEPVATPQPPPTPAAATAAPAPTRAPKTRSGGLTRDEF